MKTIQPTPSQAAVVLKRFLGEKGLNLKLSVAQEAVARMYGHSSWQSLIADVPARVGKAVKSASAKLESVRYAAVCKQCDCPLDGGYCTDSACRYFSWPQVVALSDMVSCATSTIEQHYHIGKRQGSERLVVPSIEHFETVSMVLSAETTPDESALQSLHRELEHALLNTGMLAGFTRQQGRDEMAFERTTPYIQVSLDKRIAPQLVTELVFTLRDSRLTCYVRTWHLRDGLDHSRDYGIFEEPSGDYDTDAERPAGENSVAALVRNALEEADAHKARVVAHFNLR